MDESLRDPLRDPCARDRPEGYTQGHIPQVQQPRFIPNEPATACLPQTVLPPPGRPAPAGMGAASRRVAAARADADDQSPKRNAASVWRFWLACSAAWWATGKNAAMPWFRWGQGGSRSRGRAPPCATSVPAPKPSPRSPALLEPPRRRG